MEANKENTSLACSAQEWVETCSGGFLWPSWGPEASGWVLSRFATLTIDVIDLMCFFLNILYIQMYSLNSKENHCLFLGGGVIGNIIFIGILIGILLALSVIFIGIFWSAAGQMVQFKLSWQLFQEERGRGWQVKIVICNLRNIFRFFENLR